MASKQTIQKDEEQMITAEQPIEIKEEKQIPKKEVVSSDADVQKLKKAVLYLSNFVLTPEGRKNFLEAFPFLNDE